MKKIIVLLSLGVVGGTIYITRANSTELEQMYRQARKDFGRDKADEIFATALVRAIENGYKCE